jgi:hypothetical protein
MSIKKVHVQSTCVGERNTAMFSFQFKGFLGVLAMFGLFLLTVFLLFVLPSMVATAVWNALVYATLGGIKISLMQGGLLWVMVVMGLVLYFKPSLKIGLDDSEFDRLDTSDANFKETPKVTPDEPRSEHWKKWRKAAEDEKKAKSGN